MDKMKMETANKTLENLAKLKEMFPEVITESKDVNGEIVAAVDARKLEQLLSTKVIEGDECYDFTWVGKKQAMVEACKPIRKTLRPCREESVNWENTQNLYIEGDNLDVLKLLQESYLNKVKMIYIDPPYNTGNDSFIYPDDYSTNKELYDEEVGAIDESGYRMFKNTETNGRFHSSWCSMIYPRLKLARNLLSEDGVIFISIDDNEVTNLTKICDDIFGDRNRIALICHKSRASISNDKIISPNHNTILFYAKEIINIEYNRKYIGLDPELENFDNTDEHGDYRLVPVDGPGGAKKGNPYFEFLGIKGYWRFSFETMNQKYNNGLIVKKGNSLYQKYYKSTAEKTRRTATTWWDDGGLISSATSKLKTLMGNNTFDTPKPVELVNKMLKMITHYDNNSIILDFFSGSATTAHAVMQLNAEDGGKRKFIMVQLPEVCDEKSEAYKAGYKNICEIGKERIRRAGKKIVEETGKKDLDIGFRVLKLDESNMKNVYYAPDELSQSDLVDSISNIKEGRSGYDLLYQCMLDWGLELSLPHETMRINNNEVHIVNDGDLIACFDDKVSEDTIKQIADKKPLRAVFKDSSFATPAARINVDEIFKLKSPQTTIKVL